MAKKQTATKKAKSSKQQSEMAENNIRTMIAQEAYLRAEKRGFNGGDPMMDWLEAEKEVNNTVKMDS